MKWHIEDYIRKHGHSKRVDLASLPRGDSQGEAIPRLISRERSGRWYLEQIATWEGRVWRFRLDDWAVERDYPPERISRIVNVINPLLGDNEESWFFRQAATLYVPIDLRLGLERSLQSLRPVLQDIQQDVLKLAGRGKAFESPDSEIVFRDVYCYLLNAVDGKGPAEIAAEVFPQESPETANKKVRSLLAKIRKKLGNLEARS